MAEWLLRYPGKVVSFRYLGSNPNATLVTVAEFGRRACLESKYHYDMPVQVGSETYAKSY